MTLLWSLSSMFPQCLRLTRYIYYLCLSTALYFVISIPSILYIQPYPLCIDYRYISFIISVASHSYLHTLFSRSVYQKPETEISRCISDIRPALRENDRPTNSAQITGRFPFRPSAPPSLSSPFVSAFLLGISPVIGYIYIRILHDR